MRFLILLLLASSAYAQLHPNALIVNVATSQKQDMKVHSRDARGPRDKTTSSTRILTVDCRILGTLRPEKITFRWFFIKKDGVDGKLGNHANGAEEILVPNASPGKTFIVESPPLTVRERVAYGGVNTFNVVEGDIHAGWVVWAVQDGKILRTYSSDPALADWLMKNLPPASKAKS